MKQRILLLDNYDSFTFNLKHYIEELGGICIVKRNDEVFPEAALKYDGIVLSPGPGLPEEAGVLLDLIRFSYNKKKLLGVCLGHQAMAIAAGGNLIQLERVMHGLQRPCTVIQSRSILYKGIPGTFEAGRYHSWVVDEKSLPSDWSVTAVDDDGRIMSMEHVSLPLFGVQFHPESVMTPVGKKLVQNWLSV